MHKRVPKERPNALGDGTWKLADNTLGFILIA